MLKSTAADEGAGNAGHKGQVPVDTGTLTIEQELVDGADGQAEPEDSERKHLLLKRSFECGDDGACGVTDRDVSSRSRRRGEGQ